MHTTLRSPLQAAAAVARAHGVPFVSSRRLEALAARHQSPGSLAAVRDALVATGLEVAPIQASPEQLALVAGQIRFPLLAAAEDGLVRLDQPVAPAGALGHYLVVTRPASWRLRLLGHATHVAAAACAALLLALFAWALAAEPAALALLLMLAATAIGAPASAVLAAVALGRAGALHERVCSFLGAGCARLDHRRLAPAGLAAHAALLALWLASLYPAARAAALASLATGYLLALPLSLLLLVRMARARAWCVWCVAVHASVLLGALAGVAALLERGLPSTGLPLAAGAALSSSVLTLLVYLLQSARDERQQLTGQLAELRALPGVAAAEHAVAPRLPGLPASGLLLVTHPLCPHCPAAHDLARGAGLPFRLLMPARPAALDLDRPLSTHRIVGLLRAIEAAHGAPALHQALGIIARDQLAFARRSPREAITALGLDPAPIVAAYEAGQRQVAADAALLERAGIRHTPVVVCDGRPVPRWTAPEELRRMFFS